MVSAGAMPRSPCPAGTPSPAAAGGTENLQAEKHCLRDRSCRTWRHNAGILGDPATAQGQLTNVDRHRSAISWVPCSKVRPTLALLLFHSPPQDQTELISTDARLPAPPLCPSQSHLCLNPGLHFASGKLTQVINILWRSCVSLIPWG